MTNSDFHRSAGIDDDRRVEDDLNKVADEVANEGMTYRAARIRQGAIQLAFLRQSRTDAAPATSLSRCSAGNGGAPRDWFGDLNERVGKGLNAPLEPSAGQAEAIPEGFVSVELLQIARATADRLREENANLRASNKSIFAAMDVSEDRLRSVEDLRMGDVAMEFRRLRETLLIPEPQSACRFDQDGQTCPTCGRVGNGEG